MTKQFWINLPVKDVNVSREFFGKLGFRFNPQFGNGPNSAAMQVGEKDVTVMLFDEATFKGFVENCGLADTAQGVEVLLSIDAESKEEVDELAQKAIEAGGKSNHKPNEMQGWMYGCLFTDPDGHSWNVLYMDMSKMPKG
jgi:predicted lactoylglutathione lyase